MISVNDAVKQLVENSEFARKGLRLGLLNHSAYAKSIRQDVERITKKEIKSDSAIVMALSRLSKRMASLEIHETDLKIINIISRSNLSEIAYTKTHETQEKLAIVSMLEQVKKAPFFVSTVGMTEVALITDTVLIPAILPQFGATVPLVCIEGLSCLSLQVSLETIDLPGQSYRVLEQLASRNITVVEYTTSPTELNIVLYEKDLALAFQLLHGAFLKK